MPRPGPGRCPGPSPACVATACSSTSPLLSPVSVVVGMTELLSWLRQLLADLELLHKAGCSSLAERWAASVDVMPLSTEELRLCLTLPLFCRFNEGVWLITAGAPDSLRVRAAASVVLPLMPGPSREACEVFLLRRLEDRWEALWLLLLLLRSTCLDFVFELLRLTLLLLLRLTWPGLGLDFARLLASIITNGFSTSTSLILWE
mmetsp:Transcript_7768/g.22114  ORF Transcript_7768/g.22114 Transcript_7768/m.22114 type:complete len:204 (+) Transcript_7768:384-995(+)